AYVAKRAADRNQTAFHKMIRWNAAYAAQSYTDFMSNSISGLVGYILYEHGPKDALAIDASVIKPRTFDKDHTALLTSHCECTPAKQVLYNYAYDYKTKQLTTDRELSDPQLTRIKLVLNDSLAALREGWRFNVSLGSWSNDEPVLLNAVRVDAK